MKKPARPATLKDVAWLAHVSPMTVSNVVNGKLSSVSDKTRKRILSVIQAVNYRPHEGARNLKLARRFSLGMIVVQDSPYFLADPFITNLVTGLCHAANNRGYSLALHGVRPDAFTQSPFFRLQQTDGLLLFLSGRSTERLQLLKKLKTFQQPIVLFQESDEVKLKDGCVVRQDDREGGRLLAEWLAAKGARQILMIVPAIEWAAMQARVDGVRNFAVKHKRGISVEVLVSSGESITETQQALSTFLATHPLPDAIMAGNDQMAIAAYRLLHARGVRIPGEVRITGFNAFDYMQFVEPAFTTIESPAFALGQVGGQILIDRLQNGHFARKEVTIPVALKVGTTT